MQIQSLALNQISAVEYGFTLGMSSDGMRWSVLFNVHKVLISEKPSLIDDLF